MPKNSVSKVRPNGLSPIFPGSKQLQSRISTLTLQFRVQELPSLARVRFRRLLLNR